MENLSNQLEIYNVKKSILKYSSFSLGKELINEEKLIFNPLIIKKRVALINDVLKTIIKYNTMPFLGIKNLKEEATMALKDAILPTNILLDFVSLNDGIKAVISYTYQFEEDYDQIINLTSTLKFNEEINKEILKAINNYGDIKPDASEVLKSISSELNKVDSNIIKTANKFISDNSDLIQEKVIAYRNNRACILLKNQAKYSFKGLVHGETASKQAAYVEPSVLYELNNKKLILEEEYNKEVERILFELSQIIKKYADELIASIDTLAILDMAYAKGLYGFHNNGVMATLVNDRSLLIKDARHPLIAEKDVVSNTYEIDGNTKLLLITGSNTGGKTVSLKVIGLFVIMTYLGIPVLADRANIPFYDDIFIDISDNQSVSESLSSFSSHLKVLSHITNNVTANSLILLDEIASATDPKEGEALAMAVLEFLRQKGALTICTTHFGGLKAYAKKHDDIILASVEFDKVLLKPTYRFLVGVAGQSNAFEIAKRFDIPLSIIDDAIKIKDESKKEDDLLIEKLEASVLESELIKKELALKQKELETIELSIKKEKEVLEKRKSELINEARAEANEYVKKVRQEADELLDAAKGLNDLKMHERIAVKKNIDELLKEDEEEFIDDEPLKVNDQVHLKNASHIGTIISIDKNKAVVSLNGLKVNTKLADLRKAKVQVKPVKKDKKVKKEFKPLQINLECNLIGLSYSEAEEVLAKYIDNVLMANQPYCRIIHGVGTGALKKMTHLYLKKHKSVKAFRLADYNEGGSGATYVEFK